MDKKPALAMAVLLVFLGARSVRAYDVTLSWAASSKPNVSAYRIYRRVGSSTRFSPVAATGKTQIALKGLAEGRLYYFRVSAWSRSKGELESTNEVGYYGSRDGRQPAVAAGSILEPSGLASKSAKILRISAPQSSAAPGFENSLK